LGTSVLPPWQSVHFPHFHIPSWNLHGTHVVCWCLRILTQDPNLRSSFAYNASGVRIYNTANRLVFLV
jgi:hypothetical protein